MEDDPVGIGRRKFLAMFGAELTAIAAQGQSACATHADTYINRRLGIAFRKPSGWFFNTVREVGEVAKGQLVDLDADVLKSFLEDGLQHLVVSVSEVRMAEDAGRFTCAINAFLEPVGDEGDDVVLNAMEEIRILSKIVPEFTVRVPVEPRYVSDCRAADYTAELRFDHESFSSSVIARQRSLLVVQDGWRHTFRMYDAPSLGSASTCDYSEFISSIAIL